MRKVDDKKKFREGVLVAAILVFLLFIFAIIKGFYANELQYLGIRPRTLEGVVGIFTAPVVHGDLYHLLSNAFPLLFGIPVLFYLYYKRALIILLVVYLLSGFWVWLIARNAVHLGASGVVYGLLSFLFFASIIRRNRQGLALAAVIIFLYGAPLLTGFFPTPGISFEAHIAGAVAGLFMAVYLKFDEKGAEVTDQPIPSENVIDSTSPEKINFTYTYKNSSDSEKNRD